MDLVMSGCIKMLAMLMYFYNCLKIALFVVTRKNGQGVYSTRLDVKHIECINHCLNQKNIFRLKYHSFIEKHLQSSDVPTTSFLLKLDDILV